jgi:PilZ domain-containing protein
VRATGGAPRCIVDSVAREQRRTPRLRRRLQVEYGLHDLETKGFGLDISAGGLFVTATKLLPVGARIHMRITTHSGMVFYAEGRIVRHKLVHMALRSTDPQGLGVRFVDPHEIVAELIPSAKKTAEPFTVACPTTAALETILVSQLGRGVVIVPTGDPPPEAAQELDFHVALEFLPDAPRLTGRGRVVQVLNPDNPETRGAVLEVERAAAFAASLRAAAG